MKVVCVGYSKKCDEVSPLCKHIGEHEPDWQCISGATCRGRRNLKCKPPENESPINVEIIEIEKED